MAITKPNFYISIILLAITVFSGIGYVGTGLLNTDRITLNEPSIDYIAEVKGVNLQSGYDGIADRNSADSQVIDPLDSGEDSQVSDTNDFLSTIYIKKERASEPTKFFQLVYNIPTSIIRGVGFDVGDWTNYINIFSFILLISIILMMWTKVIN
jgi:hypothetical protein